MAKIPDSEIARLKREVSLQRLAESLGIVLKPSGPELLGLCPFHDDKKPSLAINVEKNVWHCKGACGEGGDVIKWVQRAEGVSFTHAIELLQADYQPLAAASGPVKRSTVQKLPTPLASDAEDQTLLNPGHRLLS